MRPCRQLPRPALSLPVVCITALLASGAWLPAATPAGAQDEAAAEEGARETPRIYKWIDENGIAHYTTDRSRIPAGLQERFDQLGSSPAPLANEPASATAPAAAGAAATATAASSSSRRTSSDSFDSWASRNRSSIERDAWDEGEFENEVEAPPVLTAEDLAAIEAERVEIDQQILALEAEVAASENFLKEWVSVAGTTPLEREDDGTFQTAARLLPQQLAELAALRERLVSLETP